jgi:hypothetical protein
LPSGSNAGPKSRSTGLVANAVRPVRTSHSLIAVVSAVSAKP